MSATAQALTDERVRPSDPVKRRDWNMIVTSCLWAFLLADGVYRLMTFVPQPLDSLSTLRPHLFYWFSPFLRHYPDKVQAQASWSTFCFWLLLIPGALALLNYLSAP